MINPAGGQKPPSYSRAPNGPAPRVVNTITSGRIKRGMALVLVVIDALMLTGGFALGYATRFWVLDGEPRLFPLGHRLHSPGEWQWALLDSNQRPNDYESSALTD